jgi:hypothetical protein
MAAQAAPFRRARADIKAPVVHYSLSLQAGDGRKTPEEWKPIVEAFLKKMDFPVHGAWTSFLHNDTNYQHCHIALLRSLGDGKVWNREFSAKRAIQATAELEKEFGLLTHDRTTKREKNRKTKQEKALETSLKKEGKKLSKEHIAAQVDNFVETRKGTGYTVDELRAGLASVGIQVEVTERGGQLAGVKYQHDGIWISGSNIGDGYKAQGLVQRGLSAPSPAAPAPAAPAASVDNQAEKNNAAADTQAPAQDPVRAHNRRAAGLGDIFGKVLAQSIEAIKTLIRMIISMVNFLLGRREASAGAPEGSLGRFDGASGKFQPGKAPERGTPGFGAAVAAMNAVGGDLDAVGEKVQGQKWSQLVEHGPAPYKHEKGATDSYFARLRTPGGTETEVWGVDIKRALADAGINTGDQVSLERAGREDVVIKQVRPDGSVTERVTHRNSWRADKPSSEQAPSQADATDQARLREDKDLLRDGAIRYLRDKTTYLGHKHGRNSSQVRAVLADLKRLKYGPQDEIKYQAWAESNSSRIQAGETDGQYMERREIEYLEDQVHFYSQHQVGMTGEEHEAILQRLKELHLGRVVQGLHQQDREGREREGQA